MKTIKLKQWVFERLYREREAFYVGQIRMLIKRNEALQKIIENKMKKT